MHCASAALRDTATEFCAGQSDHVAQHPEKWGIGLDVDLPGCSVDLDRDHPGLPLLFLEKPRARLFRYNWTAVRKIEWVQQSMGSNPRLSHACECFDRSCAPRPSPL